MTSASFKPMSARFATNHLHRFPQISPPPTLRRAKSRYAINSTAFQRTNNRTAYVNWMLEHKQAINSWYKNPAFVRDESIAVHGKTIREAITLEFGPGALLVLRESQAWFRERVRRFLKEGGDPAF